MNPGLRTSAAVSACMLLAFAAAFAPGTAAADCKSIAPPPAVSGAVTKILGVYNVSCSGQSEKLTLGLGDDLIVAVDGNVPLFGKDWVLYLNGRALANPAVPVAVSDHPRGLIFRLSRGDQDRLQWANILGSPWAPVTMEVSLGQAGTTERPRLIGDDATFDLNILGTRRLAWAAAIAAFLLLLLGLSAVRTSILRDNLVPQIPPRERPFSLGRCQMAFWFALIFVSFLFLWALLLDYNTLSQQALTLMGISAATGLGALAANSTNDDKLKAAIKALGDADFHIPHDIEGLRESLKAKLDQQHKLQAAGAAPDASLDAEVTELLRRKLIYDNQTADYVSATYDEKRGDFVYSKAYLDIISDQDGPALSRLQVVGWTLALGLVFVAGVYQNLAMPAFDTTLLALMAVSGASYVGFKFPAVT